VPLVLAALRDFSRDLVRFFFPPVCTICGARLTEGEQVICDRCRNDLVPVLEPFCRRCGNPAVARKSDTCRLCRAVEPAFDRARSATFYAGPAEQLVRELKYGERLEVAPVAARLMFLYRERFLAFETLDLVVPVPLHSSRLRERGFNQAELIARHFARLADAPILTDAVVRVRPTQSQTRLSFEERIENVRDAFRPSESGGGQLEGKSVFLIDDVCTTGSTGSACAKALKQAGAERVVLFTFARASMGR